MKITDFIICEDIRHEVGDQYSLMGILETPMVFSQEENGENWPRRIVFCMMVRVQIPQNGIYESVSSLSVTIKINKEETLIGKQEIETEKLSSKDSFISSSAYAKINNIEAKGPGQLSVIIRLYNSNNELLEEQESPRSFRIELAEK
ncbi:hypothetical protein [Desulfotalea psychrophila]|uniref:Uncharacterized protein n=1 Tax=Desulfotalea psychrophila (strain LSv54 / DSM 12343) TaxID=177439 RepID=Q6ALJ9_DESPS|nr:hypothetical protein [Desulfotalea psychrophila]CAG36776.1 unknown protein [Desulfotalea psychrophila LSv54]